MSEGILVLCESVNGTIKKTGLEILGKAQSLVESTGGVVTALLIGSGDAASLGGFGAHKVLHVDGDARNVALVARALQQAIGSVSPALILGGATAVGLDAFARIAVRLKLGLGSEITELTSRDGAIVATRSQFAGKIFSDVAISGDCKMFTVRPGAFGMSSASNSSAEVESMSVDLEDSDSRIELVEIVQSEEEVIDLTEADRVVSGGRSVKSKESFDSLIRPLAKALGAATGASRAAVDSHYAEHSEQVGQTGKRVSPALYIACGISGAIQHLAGMNTSRVIVSINKDENAPIFKHSTYGIVADMFEVVPVLTKALNGGEIPVVDMTPKKSESSAASVEKPSEPAAAPEAKAAETAPKKMSLKERLAAKKSSASESASTVTPSATSNPVKKPEPAAPVSTSAPSSTPVVSDAPVINSAEVAALRAEVGELKTLVQQLETVLAKTEKNLAADVKKAIKSSEDSVKKDVQRSESNARSFQEGATKKIESIDTAVSREVRRIREKTREAMANEGAESRTAIYSLKSSSAANMVLNILILVVLIALMMK